MRNFSSILALANLIAVGLALSACDEAEQGRVLYYEKGTYLGEPDPTLSEGTVENLRRRATLQGSL